MIEKNSYFIKELVHANDRILQTRQELIAAEAFRLRSLRPAKNYTPACNANNHDLHGNREYVGEK